ncbi:hypothetical protein QJS10_CPA09g00572 [Acorus calamus]|uniref:VQ domain-containing protein n=1 Tax=Acorus calamus TaxID=4465 RepID=A0AAV9E3B8_ACOCL|nr:hypothetical protein QJS10_CPA09g00572 [Acorus calamus]
MDSGNSGSLQSSSGGGDEEYDSRSDTISTFFGDGGGPPPPPSNHPFYDQASGSSSIVFDSLSNYLDPFSRSPPSNLNNPLLDSNSIWPLRSQQPNPSTDSIAAALLAPSHRAFNVDVNPPPRPPPPPSAAPPPPTRNSKKRSRASRRAPTTVLTTDTTNFRAMVQEFTGIPAQPFSAASPMFQRPSRLDLFSAIRSSTESQFLLRPRAMPSPFAATTSTSSNPIKVTTSTSTNNYQPSSSQSQFNVQNQMFSLQSLLQPNVNYSQQNNYSLSNMPVFGSSKSMSQPSMATSSDHPQLKMGDYCAAGTSTTSEFEAEKEVAESGTSRGSGEGTVDYWICSSD